MNETLERSTHAAFVKIGKVASKLLPDRIPVTFAGTDAVDQLAQAFGHQGLERVLIVTDGPLVELGIVGQITDALDRAEVASAVFSDVKPDPTFDVVETGARRYRSDGCDGVVAVGGGSPMDAAKMIAALATNDRPLAKLAGKFKVKAPPAPLFAVPTTAGTGSEVTIAAVVSDTTTHEKKFFLDPKLLPQMVALDASLMTGLPPAITAATGMDALTHAIESYLSLAARPQTEKWSTTAVRLVFEHLPTAYENGEDLAARQGMALASYYAGLAFTRTSVGFVHAFAHNLGADYGTPHGLANAIVLPHVLDASEDAARSRLADLAGVIGLDGGNESARAAAFIAAVRELEQRLDIPTTLDALRSNDIADLARRARAEAYLDYPVPRFLTQPEAEELLTRILPTT